jgi:hypothetical protein
MKTASLCLLSCLFVAGCGENAPPPDSPEAAPVSNPAVPTEEVAIMTTEELAGEYRVAGIDGAPTDENFGIALSISAVPSVISFDEECGTFSWATDMEGGVLFTSRLPAEPPSCDTPIHPRLLQLAAAIDAADRAARTPANGVELSGDGRSVLLFSQ